jgi:predicted alpha/beta-hydrolase family hydrolase
MNNGQRAGIDEDQCVQLARGNGWLWSPAEQRDDGPAPTLIMAHGAGAPMDSDFMNGMAERLAARGVNVLRFEFVYMAQRRIDGRKRPPNPQVQLLDCWRQVYAQLRPHVAGRLAIGGKSMGGRMASLLADELGVDGLVCLGYPFYAVGKPEKPRTAHLAALQTPTLIMQGERDTLGNRQTVEKYELSTAIEIQWVPTANHDLKPLKSLGVSDAAVLDGVADTVVDFINR